MLTNFSVSTFNHPQIIRPDRAATSWFDVAEKLNFRQKMWGLASERISLLASLLLDEKTRRNEIDFYSFSNIFITFVFKKMTLHTTVITHMTV